METKKMAMEIIKKLESGITIPDLEEDLEVMTWLILNEMKIECCKSDEDRQNFRDIFDEIKKSTIGRYCTINDEKDVYFRNCSLESGDYIKLQNYELYACYYADGRCHDIVTTETSAELSKMIDGYYKKINTAYIVNDDFNNKWKFDSLSNAKKFVEDAPNKNISYNITTLNAKEFAEKFD